MVPFCAEVAELVDAADSKSAALKSVWVRFPPPAPDLFIASYPSKSYFLQSN